ncbi:Wadjet anti-phage system protein JetD domain-containing protein [Burkholderia sp. RS01]|uniref:Wadjet anti-phage system protein JetD domain-containing protein n=1 Tax=unclassified Burkholderia TaxID=2613784 RepID=UPI003218A263
MGSQDEDGRAGIDAGLVAWIPRLAPSMPVAVPVLSKLLDFDDGTTSRSLLAGFVLAGNVVFPAVEGPTAAALGDKTLTYKNTGTVESSVRSGLTDTIDALSKRIARASESAVRLMADFRSKYVESVLMDEETLLSHRDAWATEPSPSTAPLTRLTPGEAALYEGLGNDACGSSVRLEQELIHWDWARRRLAKPV